VRQLGRRSGGSGSEERRLACWRRDCLPPWSRFLVRFGEIEPLELSGSEPRDSGRRQTEAALVEVAWRDLAHAPESGTGPPRSGLPTLRAVFRQQPRRPKRVDKVGVSRRRFPHGLRRAGAYAGASPPCRSAAVATRPDASFARHALSKSRSSHGGPCTQRKGLERALNRSLWRKASPRLAAAAGWHSAVATTSTLIWVDDPRRQIRSCHASACNTPGSACRVCAAWWPEARSSGLPPAGQAQRRSSFAAPACKQRGGGRRWR